MSESTSITEIPEPHIIQSLIDCDKPLFPAVRYGTTDIPQEPNLRCLNDPVPPSVMTVSPIYLLTEQQFKRQEDLQNSYAVQGSTCIAKELQDECEQDGRVLYPVYVESDAYEKGRPLSVVIDDLTKFVNSWLNVSPDECTFYFSGNRSIHVHLPQFVVGEEDRNLLKKMADDYNDEETGQIDTGIYSRKRQFRLPGVEHQKTGLPKVKIEPEWSHQEIIRRATTTTASTPDTYLGFLTAHYPLRYIAKSTIGQLDSQGDTGRSYLNEILSAETSLLRLNENGNANIETPIFEQTNEPDDPVDRRLWKRYNRHPFSPYANADSEETRSVAIVQVQGGPFSRRNDSERRIFLPCYIYGAIGGDGEYTIEEEHGRLLLSKLDFRKADFTDGKYMAILGGRSRNSRIFDLDISAARRTANELLNNGRTAAMTVLEQHGYDVGEAGPMHQKTNRSPHRGSTSYNDQPTKSRAQRLQKRAETDGIHALSLIDQRLVANRLLQKDRWDRTWEWFRAQYGDDFDPEVTHRQLRSLVREYSDLDINVPPQKNRE